jgi:di/tricarboxylate transporter
MTFDQGLLFALLGGILGLLLWGRLRHDLVAAGGLLAGVLLGLVPAEAAFSGFSNHAVIIVALVLIASRAFENAGVLGLVTRRLADSTRPTGGHIAILGGIGAALSAVINNVAALALLMPLDVQAARKAGRPPGITLMPLAFATILGGMVTLIGTPPNIIAASIREQHLGEPYRMFDFAPVGLAVAVAGVLFVALIGWRLVPRREDRAARFASEASFKAEVVVPEDAAIVGNSAGDLDEEAERADVLLLGMIRDGHRHYARARGMTVQPGDILIVEGSTDAIAAFLKSAGLQEARRTPRRATPRRPPPTGKRRNRRRSAAPPRSRRSSRRWCVPTRAWPAAPAGASTCAPVSASRCWESPVPGWSRANRCATAASRPATCCC